MKKMIAAFAVLAATALNSSALILHTKVTQGDIEGVEHNGAALYKRIPYAEAPVGELRWKAPVPKAPWQGVYKADEWGARPPQPAAPGQDGGMSEDCLYLSVTTPANITSWLSLRKEGNAWKIVGRAPLENLARRYASPPREQPADQPGQKNQTGNATKI